MSTAAAEPPVAPPATPPEPPKAPPAKPAAKDKKTPTTTSDGKEPFVPYAQRLFGAKQVEKKPDEPKEPVTEPDPTKPVAQKPKKPVSAPKPAAMTPPVDAQTIGKAVADNLAPLLKPEKGPKDEPAAPKLEAEDEEDVSVLKKLEELDPKWKGRSEKHIASLAAVDKYETDWLAAHPGAEFDHEADEHAEFLKQHSLDDISDAEWKKAEREIIIAEAEARAEKKLKPKVDAFEASQKLAEELPKINASRTVAANAFYTEMGEAFKAILTPEGNIDVKEFERLRDDDPVNAIAFTSGNRVVTFADQAHRLMHGLPVLPKPKEPHLQAVHITPEEVEKFIVSQEAVMATLPDDKPLTEGGKLDAEGRTFLPLSEFEKLTPAQKAKHWILSEAQIRIMYAADQAEWAQKTMKAENDRIEALIAKRGYQKPGAPATPPAEPPPYIPPSPEGTVTPRAAAPTAKNPPGNGSDKNSILNRI